MVRCGRARVGAIHAAGWRVIRVHAAVAAGNRHLSDVGDDTRDRALHRGDRADDPWVAIRSRAKAWSATSPQKINPKHPIDHAPYYLKVLSFYTVHSSLNLQSKALELPR